MKNFVIPNTNIETSSIVYGCMGIVGSWDNYPISDTVYNAATEAVLTALEQGMHKPDPLMEPEEVARAFDELHKQGKVRYFGVSNFNKEQIALLQNSLDHKIIVNQIDISLLHHYVINDGILSNQLSGKYSASTGIIDYCRLNEIQLQAWSPLAYGNIFNSEDENLKNLSNQLSVYAAKKNTSVEATAISWLMKHPAGIQPIIGTTNKSRIINSCEADKIQLTREEWYTLFTLARGNSVS